jgi:hypothetical protein
VRSILVAIACVSLFSVGVAQTQIVEIEKPQLAKSVAGVVNDPSGVALPGVTVEERSEDWKTVLRSTETDGSGRFHFSSTRSKTVYYLQFSLSGFNWLRLKLQLDKKVNVPIVVKLPIGT